MVELINVTAETVDKTGFFCKMSAKKTAGYQRKVAWLKKRFSEGLELVMLGDGQRGFIETIPGPFAWRAIEADDYLVIHCLWVVGQSKGKGHSSLLLAHAEERAKALGLRGVAMVASTGHWLAGTDILEHHGYKSVAEEAPFSILVKSFKRGGETPAFCGSFAKKTKAAGKGLVVFQSDQCPYLDDATEIVRAHAKATRQAFRIQRLENVKDVRKLSPTPYGVYAVVRDGEPFSYHYLLKKEISALEKANAA